MVMAGAPPGLCAEPHARTARARHPFRTMTGAARGRDRRSMRRLTEGRLEVVSTVLLALATVATAWSAYQSRQWTGVQAQATSKATAGRIAQNRVSAVANRQVQIDVATFIQWLDATAQHHTALADFYKQRFRAEFKPAFAAWLATRPLTSRTAP